MVASDHVFKESGEPPYMEFVGDFEAEYQSQPDPWDQSGDRGPRAPYYEFSRNKLVARISNRLREGARGLEIGSGMGYLTTRFVPRYDMVGVDASETAVARARKLHPGIDFRHGDLLSENFCHNVDSEGFHFAIWAQCWWYLLHDVDKAIDHTLHALMDDGFFIVHQAFLKEQNYGREIADGFEGAVALLMKRPDLRLIEASQDDSGRFAYYDGLLMFRKVKP